MKKILLLIFLFCVPIVAQSNLLKIVKKNTAILYENGLVYAYNRGAVIGTTVPDISGHLNNGITTNITYSNNGLYFNGTNSKVTITNNTGFNFEGGDFTIAMWFYPTVQQRMGLFNGITDYWLGIDFHFSPVGTRTVNLWMSSNGTGWDIINSDPGGQGIGSISLSLNQWHSVVVKRTGNTLQSYIDGVLDVNETVSGSIVTKSENKRIGLWGNGNYPMAGYLRNIRVYNRSVNITVAP